MMREIAAAPSAPDSKGGRRENSEIGRNAVRSVMHYLDQQGMQRSGGWAYSDRPGSRATRRSDDDELAATGAARLLVEVARAFDLSADRAALKGFHDRYVELLHAEDCRRISDDYLPSSIRDDLFTPDSSK